MTMTMLMARMHFQVVYRAFLDVMHEATPPALCCHNKVVESKGRLYKSAEATRACPTKCFGYDRVGNGLKILMYYVYTPLFRPFPPRLEAPTFGALAT